MSGAIRLQLRRPDKGMRVLASLTSVFTCLWLVACGVLCARHEAHVAHYFDAATGTLRHGTNLDEHHRTSSHAHLHDSAPGGDNDACELAAHLRTPTVHDAPSLAVDATVL